MNVGQFGLENSPGVAKARMTYIWSLREDQLASLMRYYLLAMKKDSSSSAIVVFTGQNLKEEAARLCALQGASAALPTLSQKTAWHVVGLLMASSWLLEATNTRLSHISILTVDLGEVKQCQPGSSWGCPLLLSVYR